MAEVAASDEVEIATTDRGGRYSMATETPRVLLVTIPENHFANHDFCRRRSGSETGDIVNLPLIKHKAKKEGFEYISYDRKRCEEQCC
jgi:hypothetical protein